MDNNITRLYQLKIEKWLEYGEWSGTVFTSKLYPSRQECLQGCLTSEVYDVACAVGKHSNAFIEVDDADDLRKACLAGDHEIQSFMDSVKEWLHEDKECVDFDEGIALSVVWEVNEHEVAPDCRLKRL